MGVRVGDAGEGGCQDGNARMGDALVMMLGWGMPGGGVPGWGCPRVDADARSSLRMARWCWVPLAGTTSWVSPACWALPPGLAAPGAHFWVRLWVGMAGGGHPG